MSDRFRADRASACAGGGIPDVTLASSSTAARLRAWLGVIGAPLVVLAAACGGSAQIVLKRPVLDKCEAAGLSGCPDIAEGVVLYVDGNEEEGTTKVLTGAAQNSPAQIKEFALAIRQLEKIPGAEDYVGPLIKIAQFLTKTYPVEGQAVDNDGHGPAPSSPDAVAVASTAEPPAPQSPWPKHETGGAAAPVRADLSSNLPRALTADTELARIETGMATPETSVSRFACSGGVLTGDGYCIKSVEGPFVITDLSAPRGCPDELFAAARDQRTVKVTWVLDVASDTHGARLLIPPSHELIVGARAAAAGTLHQFMACRVTWSGFRPYASSSNPSEP